MEVGRSLSAQGAAACMLVVLVRLPTDCENGGSSAARFFPGLTTAMLDEVGKAD